TNRQQQTLNTPTTIINHHQTSQTTKIHASTAVYFAVQCCQCLTSLAPAVLTAVKHPPRPPNPARVPQQASYLTLPPSHPPPPLAAEAAKPKSCRMCAPKTCSAPSMLATISGTNVSWTRLARRCSTSSSCTWMSNIAC